LRTAAETTCNATGLAIKKVAFSLAAVIALGAVLCGCHSTPHPAAATSSATPAPTTSAPPVVHIQPLPVRAVTKSQVTTPDKCPPTNPGTPVAPTAVLLTCDLGRSTLFTLSPEALQLTLTRVDPPKALPGEFYEVIMTLDSSSAAAWASFTAAHLHSHVAFVRDDLVLEAPIIEEPVTSGRVAVTTQTAPAADQLAQLAGRPA
jgi:hypothetical protein